MSFAPSVLRARTIGTGDAPKDRVRVWKVCPWKLRPIHRLWFVSAALSNYYLSTCPEPISS